MAILKISSYKKILLICLYLTGLTGPNGVNCLLTDSFAQKISLSDSLKNLTEISGELVKPAADKAKKVPDENIKKNAVLIKLILQGLSRSHYQLIEVNDAFSAKVFDLYLERLDFNKRFLTQSDVEQLKKYKYMIDDEAKNGTYKFFNRSVEIINNRIKETETYYKDILAHPFNFEIDETIELNIEKITWVKDAAELKERWRKSTKFQALSRLTNQLQIQQTALANNDTTIQIKSFETLEEEIRKKLLKSHDEWYKRMDKIERSDRLMVYINSITNTYDPNTAWFPPKDKENFDIALSGRLEGIGAQLQERNGNIKVVSIVPGSACWTQGQLKAGDFILKVGQGEGEPVDIVDMRVDFAVKLIRGKKGTEVRLTVKKLDGSIIVIPIIRDVVILEETYAKSTVISRNDIVASAKSKKDDPVKRFGYIKLPKFYADFNKTGGRNCADDVKKELEKLKKENIDGLIIDLRNNRGGSLTDAVNMAGLFIEKGPIVQIKSRHGAPYILRDYDPLVHYDGPLVVMVNSFSASASEIFAAAMQNYKRGIIIGSASTFGKGTVQRFYNLDDFLHGETDDIKPLGSIKLTTQKFYRIDGGATQLKGVNTDIVLPDAYSYLDLGAKELDNAMPWDEIEPVLYVPCNMLVSGLNNLEKIKKKSRSRIKSNVTFNLIDENAERYSKQRDKTIWNLNIDKYKEEQKKIKEEAKKYKNLQKEIPEMNIYSIKSDLLIINTDSSKLQRTKAWHQNLKKDIYLFEAIAIMDDMK